MLPEDAYHYLVAEEDGEIKGYTYASQHRVRPAYQWAVDVTVYIPAPKQSSSRTSLISSRRLGFQSAPASLSPKSSRQGNSANPGNEHTSGTKPQLRREKER